MVPLTFSLCVLLFGCFVKGPFNTQRGVKNLIGQFGVLHPLHPQCGCSSVKMCEQRTWTVCCFLLGPKSITLESILSSGKDTNPWASFVPHGCRWRRSPGSRTVAATCPWRGRTWRTWPMPSPRCADPCRLASHDLRATYVRGVASIC